MCIKWVVVLILMIAVITATLYFCTQSGEKMATPELLTIDRYIGTISGTVSECCSLTWFADQLG